MRTIQSFFPSCLLIPWIDYFLCLLSVDVVSRTGKTLLAKTLARFVNVPFVIADATTLTQASWYPLNFIFIISVFRFVYYGAKMWIHGSFIGYEDFSLVAYIFTSVGNYEHASMYLVLFSWHCWFGTLTFWWISVTFSTSFLLTWIFDDLE